MSSLERKLSKIPINTLNPKRLIYWENITNYGDAIKPGKVVDGQIGNEWSTKIELKGEITSQLVTRAVKAPPGQSHGIKRIAIALIISALGLFPGICEKLPEQEPNPKIEHFPNFFPKFNPNFLIAQPNEPIPGERWLYNVLPLRVIEAGFHQYEGEARIIIEAIETQYNIRIVSPKMFTGHNDELVENLPYTLTQLEIIKQTLDMLPPQFQEILAGSGIILIKPEGTSGQPFTGSWYSGRDGLFIFTPADFDPSGPEAEPYFNSRRRLMAIIIHEATHCFTLADLVKYTDYVLNWDKEAGWSVDETGKYYYPGNLNDPQTPLGQFFNRYDVYGDLRQDVAFTVEAYALGVPLDPPRDLLITKYFLYRGIELPRLPSPDN